MHKTIITGKIIQIILAALSIKILTSVLSLGEVGRYGIAISISLMITSAVGSPISMYLNRVAHDLLCTKTLTKAFYLLFFQVILIALAIYGTAHFLFDLNSFGLSISQDTIELSIIIFISSTMNWALINVINTLGDGKSYSLLTISTVGFGVLLSYLLCTTISNSHLWWILGASVSQLTVAAYAFYIVFKIEKQNCLKSETATKQTNHSLISIKQTLKFCAPISAVAILSSFLINWYKWISFEDLNIKELGLIVGCFIFSTGIFNAVEQTSAAIFQPRFYKDLSSKEDSVKAFAWNRYAERMIGTLLLAFAAYLANIEIASKILLSSQFHNEIKILILCGVADFIRITCNIVSIRYDSTMKTKDGLVPSFFAAIMLVLVLISVNDSVNLHTVPFISIAIFSVLLFGHLIKLRVDGFYLFRVFGTRIIFLSILISMAIAIPLWLVWHADLNHFIKSFLSLLLGLFGFAYAWLKIVKPHNI